VYTLSVEHNYISLSTVGKYFYMFRPYRWAIFRLRLRLSD